MRTLFLLLVVCVVRTSGLSSVASFLTSARRGAYSPAAAIPLPAIPVTSVGADGPVAVAPTAASSALAQPLAQIPGVPSYTQPFGALFKVGPALNAGPALSSGPELGFENAGALLMRQRAEAQRAAAAAALEANEALATAVVNSGEWRRGREPMRNLTAAALKGAQSMVQPTWVFGAYHKTGCELTMQMLETLSGKKLPDPSISRAIIRGKEWVFSKQPFENYYFDPTIEIIRALPNYRFVHMVRDPSNVIVSAYRYHSRPHSSAFEDWLEMPMKVKTNWDFNFKSMHKEALNGMSLVDAPLAQHHTHLEKFNAAVEAGTSLEAYYRAAPAEEGVLVEAYRSWDEMKLMVDNYLRTRQDPNTLQVHMESTVADFEKSMRCVFSFLAESKKIDVDQALRLVDKLNLDAHEGTNVGHVMRGKYENEELYAVLAAVPHVARARQVMSAQASRSC